MELNYNRKKYLLLLLLITFSSAQELCTGGRCRVDLGSLESKKVLKKTKIDPSATKEIKNKEIKEKSMIKLSVK